MKDAPSTVAAALLTTLAGALGSEPSMACPEGRAERAHPAPQAVLDEARTWIDRGRPGRALRTLDLAEAAERQGPRAEWLQLEWQASNAARDYERLLESARRVVDEPVEGLSAPLAPFWAAHAALWLHKTSAASSALLALERSLEGLSEAERATWSPTAEQYRSQVEDAQARRRATAAAVERARSTALGLALAVVGALLVLLRR